MAQPPVPPHERAWRHPSELGPPAPEPTTTSGRALLVASAAMGFVVIGVLAVAITPGRSSGPSAVESSASSSRGVAFESDPVDIVSVAQPLRPLTATSSPLRAGGSIVTPLGDGALGIMTLDAIAALGGATTARLPTGEPVDIVVLSADEPAGVALVSLRQVPAAGGYEVADEAPAPDDMVMVQGVDSTIVAMRDVASLEVAEGAPVVDGDGELVGLCSDDDDQGTEVVRVHGDDGISDGTVATTAPR